ncbi:MAG: DNA primase catalytic subunit PriS, partial [Thermoprotei archaeon]
VIDPKSWEKVIQLIVEEEGVKIDERVTIDIKRLIRLPESLHGKTGMKVAVLSYHELEEFDVEKHAVVFPSEEVKIILKNPPKKVLNIDLSHRENFLEVPFYTFVYFLANGAEVERVKT